MKNESSDIHKTPAQIPLFLLSHTGLHSIPPAPHQNPNKAVSSHGIPDPLNRLCSVKDYCKMGETLALLFVDIGEGKACRHRESQHSSQHLGSQDYIQLIPTYCCCSGLVLVPLGSLRLSQLL